MSTSLFQNPDLTLTDEPQEVCPEWVSPRPVAEWNPETFAREQIQGLVRRVFFSNPERPVRQVVFSAAEPETDIRTICRRVGEALALETAGTVAVMGGCLQLLQSTEEQHPIPDRGTKDASVPPLRRIATRMRGNLWLVPAAARNPATTASLHSYLGELRREFEYSIVEAPPAGESYEATAMAQFADGIILVLSAQRTRRVTARRIKETIEDAHARLLGTVLSDRVFPIPEGIYRRL